MRTEHLVIGAGIAGLSLARALLHRGCSVTLIDEKEIAAGASGAPLALLNPIAAKNANLSRDAAASMVASMELLGDVGAFDGDAEPIYRKTGVLRPAADAKMLAAFRRNFDRGDYPEGWVNWLDADALQILHPGLQHNGGGLWLNEGYTVCMPHLLRTLFQHLQKSGLNYVSDRYVDVSPRENAWHVKLHSSDAISAENVYFTTGSGLLGNPLWKHLRIHPIKGQLAVYSCAEPLNWDYAIAGRGYIAHLKPAEWVIGSTFEHEFTHPLPDSEGLKHLEAKVDAMLPGLRSRSKLINHWSGIRLGTADRMPVAEPHPEFKNLWVLGGLGSKGLLYAPVLAERIAAAAVR